MSKLIPDKQKRLTEKEHIYIEDSLNDGKTFKDIAKHLCNDPTTISKEVRAHRFTDYYHKGSFVNAKNFCVHRFHCKKTNICKKIIVCGVKCSSCPTCNKTCPSFEKERCKYWTKHLMYVMNALKNRTIVTLCISTDMMAGMPIVCIERFCSVHMKAST